MNTHSDKPQENTNRTVACAISKKQDREPPCQFANNRPEAVASLKLQDIANNSPQVKQLKAIQELANNNRQITHQPASDVIQRVNGLAKQAARKLTFDDLVWGTHADHYATEKKYREKGKKIVESGKPMHTTFSVDREGLTVDLIAQNTKKRGWMDNHPGEGDDFTVSPAMDFVLHQQTPNGITEEHGHGYPVVRVRENPHDLGEVTKDPNGDGIAFFSPYHLQDVDQS
jgi:hypothetical protein